MIICPLSDIFWAFRKCSLFFCDIFPSASLNLKLHAQRTQVRFRCHFIFALLREKSLGEISGLKLRKAGRWINWGALENHSILKKFHVITIWTGIFSQSLERGFSDCHLLNSVALFWATLGAGGDMAHDMSDGRRNSNPLLICSLNAPPFN